MKQPAKTKPPKSLVYTSDANFYGFTRFSIQSFRKLHPTGWQVHVADVGMTPEQRIALEALGCAVHDFPASPVVSPFGVYYPGGMARTMLFQTLMDHEGLYLYLDADTLILGNLDELCQQFWDSPFNIGLSEEHYEIVQGCQNSPIGAGWVDRDIPAAEFPNQNEWQDKPFLNTGVIFYRGSSMTDFGREASSLYEKYEARLANVEQTIIGSMLRERGIGHWEIPISGHCYLDETFVEHYAAWPYVDEVPTFNCQPILLRHFVSTQKDLLVTLMLRKAFSAYLGEGLSDVHIAIPDAERIDLARHLASIPLDERVLALIAQLSADGNDFVRLEAVRSAASHMIRTASAGLAYLLYQRLTDRNFFVRHEVYRSLAGRVLGGDIEIPWIHPPLS